LFRLGYKRELELEDLYRVLPEDRSEHLGDKLCREWNRDVDRCEIFNKKLPPGSTKTQTPSLLKALIKVFACNYAILGIFPFMEECVLKYVAEVLLSTIVTLKF
jgi:hypothetical protein